MKIKGSTMRIKGKINRDQNRNLLILLGQTYFTFYICHV